MPSWVPTATPGLPESPTRESAPCNLFRYALVAVGFLASYLPARRASNLDPVESLRAE